VHTAGRGLLIKKEKSDGSVLAILCFLQTPLHSSCSLWLKFHHWKYFKKVPGKKYCKNGYFYPFLGF
jgi:hypothetical protein